MPSATINRGFEDSYLQARVMLEEELANMRLNAALTQDDWWINLVTSAVEGIVFVSGYKDSGVAFRRLFR